MLVKDLCACEYVNYLCYPTKCIELSFTGNCDDHSVNFK